MFQRSPLGFTNIKLANVTTVSILMFLRSPLDFTDIKIANVTTVSILMFLRSTLGFTDIKLANVFSSSSVSLKMNFNPYIYILHYQLTSTQPRQLF